MDIAVLIKFISDLTGKNMVVDQRVAGKVTVISPDKITVAEAYKVFESVLEVYGYTAIESGDHRQNSAPFRSQDPKHRNPDSGVIRRLRTIGSSLR